MVYLYGSPGEEEPREVHGTDEHVPEVEEDAGDHDGVDDYAAEDVHHGPVAEEGAVKDVRHHFGAAQQGQDRLVVLPELQVQKVGVDALQ